MRRRVSDVVRKAVRGALKFFPLMNGSYWGRTQDLRVGVTSIPLSANEPQFVTEHPLTDLRSRTVSNGLLVMMAQAAEFALTLGATMVLVRLLEPGDFGLVAMVTALTGILRIIPDAGLSTATIQREDITHAQVSNLFWTNVALSGFASIAIAACAPGIAWFYGEPRLVGITLALSVTFLLSGLAVQHLALLNRQMRFKTISLIRVGGVASGVLVGIGMAWLKCGYWSLVGSQLSMPLASFLLTWRASRWRPQGPIRRSNTWPLLGFGANVTASGFIYSLARAADRLLIGKWYGSVSLGLYSRASALFIGPVELLMFPISAVFVPVLSRLQAQPERYRRAFLQVHDAIALTGFISSGLFLPLARPLTLVVLGPQWEQAAVIVAGFTIAFIFIPLCSASSWLLTSQGRGTDSLRGSSICSIITVASFVVGLPFGPAGVAILYSASGVLILLPYGYYLAGRQGPVRTVDLWVGLLPHIPLLGVVSGATYLMRSLVAESGPLAQLLICVPFGLLAAVVFVALFAPTRRTATNLLDTLAAIQKVATSSARIS